MTFSTCNLIYSLQLILLGSSKPIRKKHIKLLFKTNFLLRIFVSVTFPFTGCLVNGVKPKIFLAEPGEIRLFLTGAQL